jgi:predicted Fe-Mo cluster-binding NifX family protein
MLIWICVDKQDKEDGKITTVMDVKHWALVELDGGAIKEINFYENREDFNDWVDCIVMKDKYESSMDFMNEGMMVLTIRDQETLSEVIESFIFRELDEVGF